MGLPPLLAVLALLAGACRTEPSPTVAVPPNPTSAPTGTLGACVVNPGPRPSSTPRGSDYTIVQPGILTAGALAANAPFESLQGGHPVGFDVDLIAEIARRLGLRPEIQAETPATILSDVAQGRADVAISALSIRADRSSAVDFTDAYYTADLALTVGVDQARGFSPQALAGRVLGVPAGTSAETCARTALATQDRLASVKAYADMSLAFPDLSVGRIGAVLADVATSDRFVQAVPGLQMVQIYRTGDAYGIAVAKSNPKLRQVINRILADMRTDGTYDLLFEKWFQVAPPG